jgi:hypothetical protein
VWPQCWDLQGPRRLEQRDLRNLNIGDLKKGPNGGVSPTPQKNLNEGESPTLLPRRFTPTEDVNPYPHNRGNIAPRFGRVGLSGTIILR